MKVVKDDTVEQCDNRDDKELKTIWYILFWRYVITELCKVIKMWKWFAVCGCEGKKIFIKRG